MIVRGKIALEDDEIVEALDKITWELVIEWIREIQPRFADLSYRLRMAVLYVEDDFEAVCGGPLDHPPSRDEFEKLHSRKIPLARSLLLEIYQHRQVAAGEVAEDIAKAFG